MKVQILSDLHLEFSSRYPPLALPATDADVVVLAGDIDNGTRAIGWAETTFPEQTVLYVPGNHEYYDAELGSAAQALQQRAACSRNVRLLDRAQAIIGGVRFIGATLWTDFELFGRASVARALTHARKYVIDFRAIRFNSDGLLTPEHTIALHRVDLDYLRCALAAPFAGKTVVITHHAPHPNSVHPRWSGDLVSAAFVSDLSVLMGAASLWIHGHTHDSFDYTHNGTRVVANPMGYRRSNLRRGRFLTPQVEFENARFDPRHVVTL